MHFSALRTQVAVLTAALLLVPLASRAKDGRDFAGFYSVNKVVEQGDQLVIDLRVLSQRAWSRSVLCAQRRSAAGVAPALHDL